MSVAPLVTRRVLVALGVFVAVAGSLLAAAHLPRAGGAGEMPPGSRPVHGEARLAQERFAGSVRRPGGDPLRAPADAPADDAMRLTVPALARVDRVPVETGGPSEERALREGALHVAGTGYPWQRGANTYIAGHRLGFPGTHSRLLFWDLNELDKGDRVLLEDADGRVYKYAVFREMVVGPEEVRVTQPVLGKSVVSLQTCTLPDYAERLVVQAELVRGGS